LHKPFEQTPRARGSAARAVPLTQGDNVLFELFSPSVRVRAARSAAGGSVQSLKRLLCKGLLGKQGNVARIKMSLNFNVGQHARKPGLDLNPEMSPVGAKELQGIFRAYGALRAFGPKTQGSRPGLEDCRRSAAS
jgi:hypothetical protein